MSSLTLLAVLDLILQLVYNLAQGHNVRGEVHGACKHE
jgi:hypothetical protein